MGFCLSMLHITHSVDDSFLCFQLFSSIWDTTHISSNQAKADHRKAKRINAGGKAEWMSLQKGASFRELIYPRLSLQMKEDRKRQESARLTDCLVNFSTVNKITAKSLNVPEWSAVNVRGHRGKLYYQNSQRWKQDQVEYRFIQFCKFQVGCQRWQVSRLRGNEFCGTVNEAGTSEYTD